MSTTVKRLNCEEYNELIEQLTTEYLPVGENAPAFDIATTMISSTTRVNDNITATYGTSQYHETTMFPTNVVECTNQSLTRIKEHAESHDRDIEDNWTTIVAHVAFELDLLDTLERQRIEDDP